MVAIASALPGRLRLRDGDWRIPARNEAVRAELAGWDGVVAVEGNPRGGSLLIRYDPSRLAPAEMMARLTGRFAVAAPPASAPRRVVNGGSAEEILDRVATRETNRAAKIGLLATTAAMLLGLGVSTRLHAAAGGINLALLAVHLAYNRKKMWR